MLCQLSYAHHFVSSGGLEPPTYCLEGSRSVRLSYEELSLCHHIIIGNPKGVKHIHFLGKMVYKSSKLKRATGLLPVTRVHISKNSLLLYYS